jgi:short-subunit dehydrogenase
MTGPDRSWALITGATSGIGRAMALQLAARGVNLVLVARSEENLRALVASIGSAHSVSCEVCAADLSQSGAPSAIAEFVAARNIPVRILINNAGIGAWGEFLTADPKRIQEQIDVNISALVRLTRLMVPGISAARAGHILNVASTAGFAPGPNFAIYYATKAFVLSFSEAIREELAPLGITVSVLCPGETATAFQARAGMEGTNLTRGIFTMNAETVARKGLEGLFAGKAVIVPGFRNKFLVLLIRLSPRSIVRKIVWLLNQKR